MKSIREIYKVGQGPSSSHTMGPERAAQLFKDTHPEADAFRVVLYGSLSKTGVGHGTDRVIRQVLSPLPTEIIFSQETPEGHHPNTMDFLPCTVAKKSELCEWSLSAAATSAFPAKAIWTLRRCTPKTPLRKLRISANGVISILWQNM